MTEFWQSLPQKPSILKNTVHVIGKNLHNLNEVNANFLLLSDEEKMRASRFKFPIHRDRFILAHGYLRKVLARYLACEAEKIEYEIGSKGKPYLKNNAQLKFNLSHSADEMLVAITLQHEIGVDIEFIKSCDARGLAQRFFSPHEWQQLQKLPESDLLFGFYKIWSQKEAYIKATGLGLSEELQNFSVNIKEPGLIGPPDSEHWTLHSFTWKAGYSSAFATKQSVQSTHYWSY